MSGILTMKCPSCGAYLEFDPSSQGYQCPYCDSEFTQQQAEAMSVGQAMDAAFDARLRSYHCQACGAELVTDDTTAATRCYYCHNPVVLTDRLSGSFHPDGVIPFTVTREQAMEAFHKYTAKRKFLDRRFLSDSQLENLNGVYYPYWLGDIAGHATFDGEGTRSHSMQTLRETIITTDHFRVHREGRLVFRNIVRKALSTVDRQLSDGIHPYDLSAVKPFDMRYLSGFLAEKRDIEKAVTEQDMMQEAQGYVKGMIGKRDHFDTLTGNSTFHPIGTSMRYLLLPCWILTYRGDKPGTTFYFMMNGQNGKVCGRLPISKSSLAIAASVAGGIVAGALMLGGALLW